MYMYNIGAHYIWKMESTNLESSVTDRIFFYQVSVFMSSRHVMNRFPNTMELTISSKISNEWMLAGDYRWREKSTRGRAEKDIEFDRKTQDALGALKVAQTEGKSDETVSCAYTWCTLATQANDISEEDAVGRPSRWNTRLFSIKHLFFRSLPVLWTLCWNSSLTSLLSSTKSRK